MSDVDDSNLRALQDNTSTMIELQLSRIKSKNDSLDIGTHNPISPSKKVSSHKQVEEEEEKKDSDDEFYDCFDNQ